MLLRRTSRRTVAVIFQDPLCILCPRSAVSLPSAWAARTDQQAERLVSEARPRFSAPAPPALPTEDRRRRRIVEESDDDLPKRRRVRASVYPHRGAVILTLGIMSLVLFPFTTLFCGPIAWSMGSSDLAEMRAGRMDPDGEGIVQAGRILGMIALGLLALVTLFYCGLFGIAVMGGVMQQAG